MSARLQAFFEQQYPIITARLESQLAGVYAYHNLSHTEDVLKVAAEIGLLEGLPEESLWIVKIAALFHDSGFLIQREHHEESSCQIFLGAAEESDLHDIDRDRICQAIMSTRMPQSPVDIVDKVLCDADLDYLGREDYIPISECLFQELHDLDGIAKSQWNAIQIAFLKDHVYHTQSNRIRRQPGVMNHMTLLQSQL
jgi:predicted metal-dependent HD superfamily phosphohydrolase